MGKKTAKKPERKSKRDRIARAFSQAKEPFSLLGTLKEEGAANAMALFSLAGAVASGATKNLRLETVKPHLKEVISSLGFAFREDLEKLESRIEELEQKLSEKEFEAIRGSDDE